MWKGSIWKHAYEASPVKLLVDCACVLLMSVTMTKRKRVALESNSMLIDACMISPLEYVHRV